MYKKGPDINSLLKMQDIMDILYKVNRIKDNSYDENYSKHLDNMPPIDKAQNIIKYISQNTDNMTKENAEIFIKILKNIDEVKYNVNNMNQKRYGKSKTGSNLSNKQTYKTGDTFDKIKNFLKSLNDEE